MQPDTRRMLEEFDRTWHILDELETPATNEEFTRTTLEMVALAAEKDAAELREELPRARRRKRLWTAAGLVGAAAAGFLLVAALAPIPTRNSCRIFRCWRITTSTVLLAVSNSFAP